MRRSALALALVLLASCGGADRSNVEDVFLERESTQGPQAYQSLREHAYDRLRREGPQAALSLFHTAYKSPGAEAVSWELLPVIARLTLQSGDRATAATHLRTAGLAQRLSLGEVVCQGPDKGLFQRDGDKLTPAYGPEDLGSALLVSTTMCATKDIYPRRDRTSADALFERKLAAANARLSGASEAPSPTP
jgi:hypothetical protein